MLEAVALQSLPGWAVRSELRRGKARMGTDGSEPQNIEQGMPNYERRRVC